MNAPDKNVLVPQLENVLVPQLGVAKTDTFSMIYPTINHYIFNKSEILPSRDGDVKEVLDFKTQITNPYRRCVGGCERDINVFFLLAEAMWIALGRKDVQFLTIFNKRMANFSDDGETFHAPYGYRLRHWGVRTEDEYINGISEENKGYDQIIDAIRILEANPNSRQVVLEIWNPVFDLGFKTKDIPCNDIVMLKIRDGKLITTIGNRSNDLHWGLPTNVFQFSFLTELISAVLGVELGTQTHNSQSLHIYEWNDIAKKMDALYGKEGVIMDMYSDCVVRERKMDFRFRNALAVNRFREVECELKIIVDNLTRIANGREPNEYDIPQLERFSEYLYNSYRLLKIYLEYKRKMPLLKTSEERDVARYVAISEIETIETSLSDKSVGWDISTLAKNFFAARLSNTNNLNQKYLGKL